MKLKGRISSDDLELLHENHKGKFSIIAKPVQQFDIEIIVNDGAAITEAKAKGLIEQ